MQQPSVEPTLATRSVPSPDDSKRSIATMAPFRSTHHEPMDVAASIEGVVPEWLRGQLVRTAPTVFEHHGFKAAHWFDALGILYAFRIGPDGVRFKQRLLDCATRTAIEHGDRSTASFGTPLERGFFKRLTQPAPVITDNTNVNVMALGDDFVALTESPFQLKFDRQTLATQGRVEYTDNEGSLGMLAHPHFDFEKKLVVNGALALSGPSPNITLYDHSPSSRNRRVFARIKLARLPYMHAFGLTPKHAIVFVHPFTVNPLSMLWSNKAFIDHFAFNAAEPTKLVVVDRNDGSSKTYEAPPCFIFHEVNSYEREDATVVEVLAYDDASIVDSLRVANLEKALPFLTPKHLRYVLPRNGSKAIVEVASEARFEFPNVAYARVSGKRHTVCWGASVAPINGVVRGKVFRVAEGQVSEFEEPGYLCGEPVFVGKPGTTAEHDGVILTVGTRTDGDGTKLFILDPQTLAVIATASVEHSVALGFHGQFFRDR